MVSQTASYALQAVLLLARVDNERPLSAVAMARQLDIPSDYLAKTLHRLRRQGVVTSFRGAHGGYRLAEHARDLTLVRVLEPFQEFGRGGRCLLGGICDVANPCAAHDRWSQVTRTARGVLERTTIGDLLVDVRDDPTTSSTETNS